MGARESSSNGPAAPDEDSRLSSQEATARARFRVTCPECGPLGGTYPNRLVTGAQAERHDERVHDGAETASVEPAQVATDGGRVQPDRRQCARCDADALPGSRFCIGHSEVLPDGGDGNGAGEVILGP